MSKGGITRHHRWFAVEEVDGKKIRLHIITTPGIMQKFGQANHRSIAAFRRREQDVMLGHHAKKELTPRWFDIIQPFQIAFDFQTDRQQRAENYEYRKYNAVSKLRKLPITRHEDVFSFYLHIGYDYKAKKYL